MTSSKPEAPLWQVPSGPRPARPSRAEGGPRGGGALSARRACGLYPPRCRGSAGVERGRIGRGGNSEAEALPPSEALEALLEQAREEARQAGEAAGRLRATREVLPRAKRKGRKGPMREGLAAGPGAGSGDAWRLTPMARRDRRGASFGRGAPDRAARCLRRLTLHLVETVLRRALGTGEDFLTPLVERALEALDERDAGRLPCL